MTSPLALVLYEKLLPGGQLVNRLQDLGYRVQVVSDPAALVTIAERDKPLVAFVDLEPHQSAVCQAIAALHREPATAHVPVVAIAAAGHVSLHEAAHAAGAKLVVADTSLLAHLEQFLDQALEVD
jgi:CheY-like chemotaxis protein